MTKKQLKDKAERKRLRDDDKLKAYAAKTVLDVISVIPVYVMLETYGWKNKRLAQFIREYSKLITAVSKNNVSIDALSEQIFAETGIKYSDGEWFDTRRKNERA